MNAPTAAGLRDVSGSRRPRPLGLVVLAVGAVSTVVSFAALSWFTVSGPGVSTLDGASWTSLGEPVLLGHAHEGTRHSLLMWAVVVVCIAAALAAQVPRIRLRGGWVAVAVSLAAAGLLNAILRVSVPRLAVDQSGFPPGTKVDVHVGVWVAIAGFVLVGVSALITPRSNVISVPNADAASTVRGWVRRAHLRPVGRRRPW